MRIASDTVRGLVVPVSLVVLAEAVACATALQSDSLARPSEVVRAGFGVLVDGTLFFLTAQTLYAATAGLLIGAAIGITLGVLLGLSQIADRLMNVTIECVRPIPSVALIPVALLLLSFGYRMEIAIVAFSTTWPFVLLTRAAVQGVEPRLHEVSRALGFGTLAHVVKIVMPSAFPRLFVAFRLAVGIALIVSITVEITGNPLGLGNALMLAGQSLQPALMLAYLCWIGLIGWAFNAGLVKLQSRFFPAFGS